MNGFHSYADFFSLIPKEIHARIYHELPSMQTLFPYEISASDISHVQRHYYETIKPIPYGVITFVYFSTYISKWVAVEVNRFHKISTVWTVHTQTLPNPCIYTGIHVFPENGPPLFVEIRATRIDPVSPRTTWPYEWMHPPELPISTDLGQQLLDITVQTPFPIYHFQFVTPQVDIPDTIIRVRDIIESDNGLDLDSGMRPGPGMDTAYIVDGRVETFRVRAGPEWDTFYLYVRDGKELVYYAPMYIQNLEQSLRWNALFRSVQQPDSYDWIEKCEKELRQKTQPGRKCTVDNYHMLDTDMVRTAKCRYHAKFGHWVPIESVPGTCRPVQKQELVGPLVD